MTRRSASGGMAEGRRRPAQQLAGRRRAWWRGRLVLRVALWAVLAGVVLLGVAVAARELAPSSNTERSRFDAIIVLGCPADRDGNPKPEQLARVTEAVKEYERGVAPRLIVTGGAVANRFVEAESMARVARAQGVPAEAVLIEPMARNTIENVCYAERIMKAHGWGSAEVVSSTVHLPRAGLILSRTGLEWRAHASPELKPESAAHRVASAGVEVVKTARYLVWARWVDGCRP